MISHIKRKIIIDIIREGKNSVNKNANFELLNHLHSSAAVPHITSIEICRRALPKKLIHHHWCQSDYNVHPLSNFKVLNGLKSRLY